jgi:hypothetical protein
VLEKFKNFFPRQTAVKARGVTLPKNAQNDVLTSWGGEMGGTANCLKCLKHVMTSFSCFENNTG